MPPERDLKAHACLGQQKLIRQKIVFHELRIDGFSSSMKFLVETALKIASSFQRNKRLGVKQLKTYLFTQVWFERRQMSDTQSQIIGFTTCRSNCVVAVTK